jgi:hypothetical protein
LRPAHSSKSPRNLVRSPFDLSAVSLHLACALLNASCKWRRPSQFNCTGGIEKARDDNPADVSCESPHECLFARSSNPSHQTGANTYFRLAPGGAQVGIHTSCSVPLAVGDQFGPFVVRGFTTAAGNTGAGCFPTPPVIAPPAVPEPVCVDAFPADCPAPFVPPEPQAMLCEACVKPVVSDMFIPTPIYSCQQSAHSVSFSFWETVVGLLLTALLYEAKKLNCKIATKVLTPAHYLLHTVLLCLSSCFTGRTSARLPDLWRRRFEGGYLLPDLQARHPPTPTPTPTHKPFSLPSFP